MTQLDLLEWVQAHGCEITHHKKSFYRVINQDGQAMGIPSSRQGHNNLQPMTVCRICTMLKIPIPDFAKQAYEAYSALQKDHEEMKKRK